MRRLVLAKRIESAIGLIPFVIFGCYVVTVSGSTPILTSILFNAYIFVAALVTFIRGTLVKKVSLLNSSILTLIAMFGARFFDPSFTFIERGVSFLVLGIIVLGINAIYLWRKGKQRATVNQRVRQARRQVADVATIEEQAVSEETNGVEPTAMVKEEE